MRTAYIWHWQNTKQTNKSELHKSSLFLLEKLFSCISLVHFFCRQLKWMHPTGRAWKDLCRSMNVICYRHDCNCSSCTKKAAKSSKEYWFSFHLEKMNEITVCKLLLHKQNYFLVFEDGDEKVINAFRNFAAFVVI